MNAFMTNLILAIAWVAVMGPPSWANFFTGFVVAYFVLLWVAPLRHRSAYFRKVPAAFSFILFFLWELTLSNLRVAYEVITPFPKRKPAIVGVPLDVKTDIEITLLANLITLTPGTMSLDVSPDRSVLYIHALFVNDAESFRREIKEGFERRVIELLR